MEATEQNTDEAASPSAAIQVGLSGGQVRQLMGDPRAVTSLGENRQEYEYPAVRVTLQDDAVTVIQWTRPQRQSASQPPTDAIHDKVDSRLGRTRLLRFALLAVSYIAAMIITFVVVKRLPPSPNSQFIPSPDVEAAVIFPWGLFLAFDAGRQVGSFGILFGNLIYLAVAILAVRARRRKVFAALFGLFALLLLVTMGGCVSFFSR